MPVLAELNTQGYPKMFDSLTDISRGNSEVQEHLSNLYRVLIGQSPSTLIYRTREPGYYGSDTALRIKQKLIEQLKSETDKKTNAPIVALKTSDPNLVIRKITVNRNQGNYKYQVVSYELVNIEASKDPVEL